MLYLSGVFLLKKAVISYGMFDQIRVDNKTEFYLMLGMQELHKELRRNHMPSISKTTTEM